MGKKIALAGLYSIPNMGDQILCEVSEYLIHQTDASAEVIRVDVCPRYPSDYHGLEYVKYRISRKLKTMGEKHFRYEDHSTFRYHYERFMWKLRLNRYYKKAFSDADAIIFAGGGFLKFRTQGLNYYVELIMNIAKRRGIPVMMNGVGIEGYDENDIRCRKLKEIINGDCMKIITTRDDVEILQNCYVTNPKIRTARVGDPALWTPECYGISRAKEPGIIGINTIRGKVFRDYGNVSSSSEVLDFYVALLQELDRRGLPWVLFSNGMEADQKFGRLILKKMQMEDPDKLLPRPKDPEAFLAYIRTFRCIFGARLHACITAYSLDVPVVGFIWNEKTRIFADMIGKKENFFEEDEMKNIAAIADRIEAAAAEPYDTAIRDTLKDKTEAYLADFLKEIA